MAVLPYGVATAPAVALFTRVCPIWICPDCCPLIGAPRIARSLTA